MSPKSAGAVRPPYMVAADALKKNKGQWAAYESQGNCVILAGPGSGKTKTLTIKMARLLSEDVRPPRGIACITYNNQCTLLNAVTPRSCMTSGSYTIFT
jgi:hypothetical protein